MSPNVHEAELGLEIIDDSPYQNRSDYDPDELDRLADDIRLHGQLDAILVVPSGIRFRIVSGHRRVRALAKLGRTTARCRVVEGWDAAQEAAAVNAANNLHLQPSDADRFAGIQTMLDLGIDLESIASAGHEKLDTVRQAARGKERASHAAAGRQLDFETWKIIDSYDEWLDDADVEAIADASERWEALEYAVDRKKARQAEQLRADLEASGIPVIDKRPEFDYWPVDEDCGHDEQVAVVVNCSWMEAPEIDRYCSHPDHAPAEEKPDPEAEAAKAAQKQRQTTVEALKTTVDEWLATLTPDTAHPSIIQAARDQLAEDLRHSLPRDKDDQPALPEGEGIDQLALLVLANRSLPGLYAYHVLYADKPLEDAWSRKTVRAWLDALDLCTTAGYEPAENVIALAAWNRERLAEAETEKGA